MLLLPFLVYFAYRDGLRTYYFIMPRWKTVQTLRVDDCTARRMVARNPDDREARAVITTGGATLLDITDAAIEFGADQQRNANLVARSVGAGEPNNGIPTLVVFSYSGGAHCCYTVYVLELTSPARIIATIDGRNGIGLQRSGPAAPHADELELNLADQSFDYWNASHAESPFPSVWYRIRAHHLELALDKMLQPAASVLARHTHPDAADASIPRLNTPPSSAAATSLSSSLWACMLDLIYSGNEPECWQVFEANWPAQLQGPPSKAAFKQEFLETLRESPQYQDFQAARTAAAAGLPPPPALAAQFKPQPPP